MKVFKSGIIVLFCLLPMLSMAQSVRKIKPVISDKPIIITDYSSGYSVNTRVPYRGNLNDVANARLTGNPVVFDITYINFTQVQQDAFQRAVDIWSSLLQSDVIIYLRAEMRPFSNSNTLGSTDISQQVMNFANAQKRNTFYNMAMAEKMAGYDLNDPGEPDIAMQYNTNFDWYFGLDGQPPGDEHDFVTVVLHEIGHGLGFSASASVSGGLGTYTRFGDVNVYMRNLETGSDQNIVDTFEDNSPELGTVLTGEDVHFRSFSFPGNNDRPTIYAPSTFNSGSSISHLDDATYPEGNVNSLMTHAIAAGESIHDPGLAYEMFQDLGWVAMDIDFAKLLDSEDLLKTRTITATINGDSAIAPAPGSIVLHYTYTDFASEVVVDMTSTGMPDEYEADIPPTGFNEEVLYFVEVNAVGGKTFTSPGEAPIFYWNFIMAKDTIAPVIEHDSINIVLLNKSEAILPIEVTVSDNIGVGDLNMTYKINGGATTTVNVPLITSDTTDGFFIGEYRLDWDIGVLNVTQGDIIEYKFNIQDVAGIPNSTMLPKTGFYLIDVHEFSPPVTVYENNFNSATNDFLGDGFTIGPATGFDSDAIHSDHPYRVINGVNNQDTMVLLYMLKTPIILSDIEASLAFDEVVLVEPGEAGDDFGDENFWDYVIVEASNDFGVNWQPVADGYDSNQEAIWLERWDSESSNGNSIAEGDKSIFVRQDIDMTANGNFVAGDTIILRFRIYIDPFTHGWGWVIDNLKIQIDEKPPVITQITPDYMMPGDTQITLRSKVVDNIALDSVIYEVDFNGQTEFESFPGTANLFTFNIDFDLAITETDVLKYRIIAVDKAPNPNTSILPLTGFFEVPVATLGEAKSMYINDFNTATDDFIGVNFNITQPAYFSNPALVSASPYPDAPFETSEITYLLKYPITLDANGAWVLYDEEVLVEPGVDEVAFEVSKDGGTTWIAVFDPYSSAEETLWTTIFNNFDGNGNSIGVGESSMMRRRIFNILSNTQLSGGDDVLVRFRMTINDNVHGWGWIIDNLEIQGPTTGIEDDVDRILQVYPNPTSTGSVIISGALSGTRAQILVTDILGKIVYEQEAPIFKNNLQSTLNLARLKNGIYIISVSDDIGIYTSRVIIE